MEQVDQTVAGDGFDHNGCGQAFMEQLQQNGRELSVAQIPVFSLKRPDFAHVRPGKSINSYATEKSPGVVNWQLESTHLTTPARSVAVYSEHPSHLVALLYELGEGS